MSTATTIHAMRLSDVEEFGIVTRTLFYLSCRPIPNLRRADAGTHFAAGKHPRVIPEDTRKRRTRRGNRAGARPLIRRGLVPQSHFSKATMLVGRRRDLGAVVAAE